MKQLELQLQKRLLIVEYERNEDLIEDFEHYQKENVGLSPEKKEIKIKVFCKGSEPTEEIAKSIVGYKYASKNQSKMSSLNYLKSFISAIETNGFWWAKNPIKHPDEIEIQPASLGWWMEQEKNHLEAQSKTFNPEKCIIFEIL